MKINNILALFIILASSIILSNCSSAKDSGKFASHAAQGGMSEVELGRLAVQRAADPAVREFGQRMVSDHTAAGNELKAVAAKRNIQLPNEINAEQKSLSEKLGKLSGPEFDKEYMSAMVKDHEEDVKDFQTQASDGTDPDVKTFAGKTLPTLQGHLQMARDTAKKVGAY
jgi:putative membrane protein